MKKKIGLILTAATALILICLLFAGCGNKQQSGSDKSPNKMLPTLDAMRILPQTNPFNGDEEHDVCLEVTQKKGPEKFDIELILKNPDKYEIVSVTVNEEKIPSSEFDPHSDSYRIYLKGFTPDVMSGDYEVCVNEIRYLNGANEKTVTFKGSENVKNVRVAPSFKVTVDMSGANIQEDMPSVSVSYVKFGDEIKIANDADMNGTGEKQLGYSDYIFVGWFTDEVSGERMKNGDKFLLYSDVTLYARYARAFKYTVYDDHVAVIGLSEEGKQSAFTIVIPDEIEGKPVTTIERYAFTSVGSGKVFELGNNVTDIETGAFRNCQNLQIDLNRVERIGNAAFEDCGEIILGKGQKFSALRIAELPSTLEEIGDYAFRRSGFDLRFPNPARDGYYTAEKTLFIPATVKKIGKYAFQESLFRKVLFAQNNLLPQEAPLFSAKDGKYDYSDYDLGEGIFMGSASLTTVFTGYRFTPSGFQTVVAADNGLKIITDKMFYNCRSLRSYDPSQSHPTGVFLGEGVSFIGEQAFASANSSSSLTDSGMESLKNQEFPASLRVIEKQAFANSALERVSFKEGSTLEILGDWCFQETHFDTITLYNVYSYGKDPFWGNLKIRTINLLTRTVPTYSVPVTSTLTRYVRFYVYADMLRAFRNAEGWSTNRNNDFGSSIANIMCAYEYVTDDYCYEPVDENGNYDENSSNVRINFIKRDTPTVAVNATFTVRDGDEDKIYTVTRIGSYVLLPTVREVKLPETVTHIDDYAFYALAALNKVIWVDFSGKTIPDKEIGDIALTRIGRFAFYATSITSFYSNRALKEIGQQAFEICSKLDTVVLNDGDKLKVGGSAFSKSTVNILVIGEGVDIIEGAAFASQSDELTIYFKSPTPPYAGYYSNGEGYYSALFPFDNCRNISKAYLFSDEAMSNYRNSKATGYKDLKKVGQVESAYVRYAGTWESMISSII